MYSKRGLEQGVGVHQRHIMDALDLQAMPRPPIPHYRSSCSSAHAGDQPVATDQIAAISATINSTAISVHDDTVEFTTPGDRYPQGRDSEVRIEPHIRSPANDLSAIEVHKHGEVEPALCSPQGPDISVATVRDTERRALACNAVNR